MDASHLRGLPESGSVPPENKRAWLGVPRLDPPKRSVVQRIADFLEISCDFDAAAAMEQASRCIQCPNPSCAEACPLSNRIPEWLALTAEGHFLEAAVLSRSTSNMPEICGRICPQDRLCEGACILNGRAEPVSIGALERFVNEYALAHRTAEPARPAPNGFGVAVVGSGPGGLACADELSRLGYAVTIFEAQPVPGGLLVNGIPAFKLDKTVVERRIQILQERGVQFRLGITLGQEIQLKDLQNAFDAIFLGLGAYQAKAIAIPGSDLQGVVQALPFLIQKNAGLRMDIPDLDVAGKQVAVLGGGDTAMDCLRTAIRCGAASTVCLYRRDLENMPGSRKEYVHALEEGAQFHFLTNPTALLGDSARQVERVQCVRMELGTADATGRRRPSPVPGSEFSVPANLVLVAYGFDPVPFPARSDLIQIRVNEWGGIVVDENQMSNVPGVFAGGDLVRGPSLVAHAVRDARRAAAAMHRYVMAKHPRNA